MERRCACETIAGARCSRKVKGRKIFCYQHDGSGKYQRCPLDRKIRDKPSAKAEAASARQPNKASSSARPPNKASSTRRSGLHAAHSNSVHNERLENERRANEENERRANEEYERRANEENANQKIDKEEQECITLYCEGKPCTSEIIKKQYHSLARRFHPDKGGDPGKFIVIKNCHDLLLRYPEIWG